MYIGVCRGLNNDKKSMQNVQNADMQLNEADKLLVKLGLRLIHVHRSISMETQSLKR